MQPLPSKSCLVNFAWICILAQFLAQARAHHAPGFGRADAIHRDVTLLRSQRVIQSRNLQEGISAQVPKGKHHVARGSNILQNEPIVRIVEGIAPLAAARDRFECACNRAEAKIAFCKRNRFVFRMISTSNVSSIRTCGARLVRFLGIDSGRAVGARCGS